MKDSLNLKREKSTAFYFFAGIGLLLLQVFSYILSIIICPYNCGGLESTPVIHSCIITGYFIFRWLASMQSESFNELRNFLLIIIPLVIITILNFVEIAKFIAHVYFA